jgi:hypothetical protein
MRCAKRAIGPPIPPAAYPLGRRPEPPWHRRWDSNPVPCCSAGRGRGGEGRVTCDSGSPDVTARARGEPAVTDAMRTQRGPGSRAWKARPVSVVRPDATPMAQVRPTCDGPLLTVGTRQAPVLRARGGHGRRGRTRLRPAAVGHQLGRWARLVHADHLPRWQAAGGRAAAGGVIAAEVGS